MLAQRRTLLALVAVVAACGDSQDPRRARLLDVSGHVVVTRDGPFAEHREVAARAAALDALVEEAAPFVSLEVVIGHDGRFEAARVEGVDPRPGPLRDALARHVDQGHMIGGAATPGELATVVLGRDLARRLDVTVGDRVVLALPLDPDDQRPAPVTREARVVGTLALGPDDLDARLAFTSLAAAQDLAGRGDQASGVKLWLRRPGAAARLARALGQALGSGYRVRDWCQLNRRALRC